MTDGEGRFRLTGIGRDRIVDIDVEGPTIQSATITAMTRDAAAISMPKDAFMARTVYGATFDHLIPPGRALTGVVRDKRTGRPLAGVKVAGKETNARTTTDAEGRYTLPGFPKGKSYGLMVLAGRQAAVLRDLPGVSDTAGLDPLRADVECVPGIPMRLKLIDKETGRPPKGAEVSYWPLHPNPHTREVPGFAPGGQRAYNRGSRRPMGPISWASCPAPGPCSSAPTGREYRPACVDPGRSSRTSWTKRPGEAGIVFGDRNMLLIAAGDAAPAGRRRRTAPSSWSIPPTAPAPSPPRPCSSATSKREVRVLGPDGQPLEGVTCQDKGAEATKTPGVMTVSRLNPMRPKRFTFRHDGRKLVGFLLARGTSRSPTRSGSRPGARSPAACSTPRASRGRVPC